MAVLIFLITAILVIIAVAVCVAFLVFNIMGKWKLFIKAGKQGWEAIVPFYSGYVLLEISGINWWWIFLMFGTLIMSIITSIIPFLGFLSILGTAATVCANVAIAFNLAAKFHKEQDKTWIVLASIFSSVMIPLLGFSKKEVFDASVVVDPNSWASSFIDKNFNSQKKQQQPNPNNVTPTTPNLVQNPEVTNVETNVATEETNVVEEQDTNM